MKASAIVGFTINPNKRRKYIMSEIILDSNNFDEVIKNSKLPVLVDFWAPWCGPCRMLAPTLAEFAEENEEKIIVAKVNVDENETLAYRYNLNSIPCLMLFKNGEVVRHTVGLVSRSELDKFLD